MKRLLYLLAILSAAACTDDQKTEYTGDPTPIDEQGAAMTLSVTTTDAVPLRDNMQLYWFSIEGSGATKHYTYKGNIALPLSSFTVNGNVRTRQIQFRYPPQKMGVMIVAQEEDGSPLTFTAPAPLAGTDAVLVSVNTVNYPAPVSGPSTQAAPGILASTMTDIDWSTGGDSQTLGVTVKRIVSKLVLQFSDPQKLYTKNPVYFAVTGSAQSMNYALQSTGKLTSAAPVIIPVDTVVKQNFAYLIPSTSSPTISLSIVGSVTEFSGDVPQLFPNKVTTVNMNYLPDIRVEFSATVSGFMDGGSQNFDPFDAVDAAGVGYYAVQVGNVTWLDRNLGARRTLPTTGAALTSDDDYGYLFQAGRMVDGHQRRQSATTPIPMSYYYSGNNGLYVLVANWMAINAANSVSSLWTMPTQVNNPCPQGYRVPTYNELYNFYKTLSYNATTGVYSINGTRRGVATPLYFVSSGFRRYDNGQIQLSGIAQSDLYFCTSGISSATGEMQTPLITHSGSTPIVAPIGASVFIGHGMSVRCVAVNSTFPT